MKQLPWINPDAKMLGLQLVLASMILVCCGNKEPHLAAYDGGEVSQDKFLNHYNKYLSVTGVEDNLPDRFRMLRSVIHEELILKDWHEKELDALPKYRQILKRQEEQTILNAWYAEIARIEEQPQPDELAQMLVNEKSRYHLLESTHTEENAAWAMRQKWTEDPELKDYLDHGFVSLEDLHPRFAESLTQLNPGEVSVPIRVGDGYSLIKLMEKKAPLFIRPREFASARKRLSQEWLTIQSDSAVNSYTQTRLRNLDIEFLEEGCQALLGIIRNTSKSNLISSLEESKIASLPVCVSSDMEWSIALLAPHLIDSKSEHLAAVIDIADLEKLISGVLVRRALINEARDAGIHNKVGIVDAIQKRQDLWRISRWQNDFADTVAIAQKYITQHAQQTGDLSETISYRDVEFLSFDDSVDAGIARSKLLKGQAVQGIDNHYTSNINLPRDGQMGWVSTEDLGIAASIVFGEELNRWTKPWSYDGETFIFRSRSEKFETREVDFSYVELESKIRAMGAPAQLEQKLLSMEKDNHIILYDDQIKSIPFIKLPGRINEG